MNWDIILDPNIVFDVSADARLIYAGLGAQVGAALLLRRSLADPAMLGAALAGVAAAAWATGIGGSLAFVAGMAAPLFLFLGARFTPGLFIRR